VILSVRYIDQYTDLEEMEKLQDELEGSGQGSGSGQLEKLTKRNETRDGTMETGDEYDVKEFAGYHNTGLNLQINFFISAEKP